MSILGKIMDSVKFNPEDNEDDYFIDEYGDEDDDYDDPDEGRKGGLFGRRASEEKSQPERKSGGFLSRKVVPIREGRDGGMEVTMIKPTTLEDSRDIVDYLLAGKAVVLNMEGMNMDIAQRIIDFTSGATYSMDGNLQMISKFIFIATPGSVELSGDFQDILSGAGKAQTVSGLNFNV
ncbi:MAG: cell division protein SepF [Eubacteriales bacterium]|nr:cell division protein SepF [Eubacteriales bacterium]